jgi:DNA-binding NtrC family response regulator
VLLLEDRDERLRGLQSALSNLSVETTPARTFEEASEVLQQADPPYLVFTGTKPADGTWWDVLGLAARAAAPVNVIVVAPVVDVHSYVDALQSGAFDYITLPFTNSGLDFVLKCAATDVAARRRAA